jgi:hypothetical protein
MGYIYAMSNKSMPGILKIGMTERSIEERLKEANGTFTLIPFVVEMSKNVLNCKEKEKCIHQILQSKRVNPKKEFFEVTIEEIKPIFDLMDSVENQITKEIIQDEESKKNTECDNFDILFGIHKIYYGMLCIDIDHNNKVYIIDNKSYKKLKFVINYIDSQFPCIVVVNDIIDNNIKQNKSTTITKLEIFKSFKTTFEKIFDDIFPYKSFLHVLSKKYPIDFIHDKMIGFEIVQSNTSEINTSENYLDQCYVIIGERMTLNDYYKSIEDFE